MIESFPWNCPHCGHDTTITDRDTVKGAVTNHIKNADDYQELEVQFVVCPNKECRKFALSCHLQQSDRPPSENMGREYYGNWDLRPRDDLIKFFQGMNLRQDQSMEDIQEALKQMNKLGQLIIYKPELQGSLTKEWNLIPPSKARIFPDYVPEQIRKNYTEACLIVNLSPNASAALARKCLEGMIRNFWKVPEKRNLHEQLEVIKGAVDPSTWASIDSVRRIARTSMHMKEVNVIIDVDVDEAERLIWLIETLVKDWYINREERETNFESINKIAEEKEQQRRSAKAKKESDVNQG